MTDPDTITYAAIVLIKDGTSVIIDEYDTVEDAMDGLPDWQRLPWHPGETLVVVQVAA